MRRILVALLLLLSVESAYSQISARALQGTPPTGGISFAGGYPLDTVTATYTSACGVGALTSSWKTGNLFDVVVGGVTTTIKGVGAGYPDVVTLASALGIDPYTGIGGAAVPTCYDQSGHGLNWTQTDTTPGRRPMVWLIQGKVYLDFDGGLNIGVAHAFFSNATIAINNQSVTTFVSMIPFSDSGEAQAGQLIYGTIVAAGLGDPAEMLFVGPSNTIGTGSQTSTAYVGYGDKTNGIITALQPGGGIQAQIYGIAAGASNVVTTQNNLTNTTAAMAAGSHVGANFGNEATDSFPLGGRVTSLMISSTVFNSTQITAFKTALAAWSGTNLNVNKSNAVNVVVDGASSDIGQGSVPGIVNYETISGGGYGYTEWLKDYYASIGKQVSWHNFSVSGASIADRTADYTSGFVQNSSFQSGSAKNILIAPGITILLTLQGNGFDGAAAYSAFLTWLSAAKSVGWTRIACILYPDLVAPGMSTYNSLMIANAASNGIDILDGRSILLGLLQPGQENFDGHPTVPGSAIYANQLIRPYLDQFMFLLRRDVDPAANDNTPLFLNQVA